MPAATAPDRTRDARTLEFERIFREYAPMVYRTARAITGSREEAEDIVQTLFLRLVRGEGPAGLQPSPKAYLYRAAVNLSIDSLRKRRRHVFTDDLGDLQSPAPVATTLDEIVDHRLEAALAQLPPEAVQILVLRYVHDYEDTEIARLLGTSRGAIALRLFRVRGRLKKLLGGSRGEKP